MPADHGDGHAPRLHVRAIAGAASEAAVNAKPHGRDCPDRCSQCIGATPRKVEQDEDVLLVDGVPVRAIAGPLTDYRNYRRKARR